MEDQRDQRGALRRIHQVAQLLEEDLARQGRRKRTERGAELTAELRIGGVAGGRLDTGDDDLPQATGGGWGMAIRRIFEKVNRLLYESTDTGKFVTAFYGVLDVKNRVFTFSNAGSS